MFAKRTNIRLRCGAFYQHHSTFAARNRKRAAIG
jgi:hypothetical protein